MIAWRGRATFNLSRVYHGLVDVVKKFSVWRRAVFQHIHLPGKGIWQLGFWKEKKKKKKKYRRYKVQRPFLKGHWTSYQAVRSGLAKIWMWGKRKEQHLRDKSPKNSSPEKLLKRWGGFYSLLQQFASSLVLWAVTRDPHHAPKQNCHSWNCKDKRKEIMKQGPNLRSFGKINEGLLISHK